MAFALKKLQYKTQIRKQNINKILQDKKSSYYLSTQVNKLFQDYLLQIGCQIMPKTCVYNFGMINEQNLLRFLGCLDQNKIRLDLSKPENIAFINKISLLQNRVIGVFFQDITNLAEKIIFALKGNEMLLSSEKGNCSLSPNQALFEDLIYMPNCLLEYWANFFAFSEGQTLISSYCTIIKIFVYWFGSQPNKFKNFNKYSLCYFIINFMKHENVNFTLVNLPLARQVEELHIKFRIISIRVVVQLIEEKFFCQQLVEILRIIGSTKNQANLYLALGKLQKPWVFFDFFILGIQNQNHYLGKQGQFSIFILSQNLTQENITNLQRLSISEKSSSSQNVAFKIWQTKINVMEVLNSYLILPQYQKLFFKGKFQQTMDVLIKLYIYGSQRGGITGQVQKSVCLVLYNVLILAQNLDSCDDEATDVVFSQAQASEINNRLKAFIQDRISFIPLIQKTSFQYYDQTVDFIGLLDQIGHLLNKTAFDQQMLNKSHLIQTICDNIKQKQYNPEESKKILSSLIQLIRNAYERHFCFIEVLGQIQLLMGGDFVHLICQQDEGLLGQILMGGRFQLQVLI